MEITWQCKVGHFKKQVSSDRLTVKHHNPMYKNDCAVAVAIIVPDNNYDKLSFLLNNQIYLRFQKHCAETVVKDVWAKMWGELCGGMGGINRQVIQLDVVFTQHATKVVVDFEVVNSRDTGDNSSTM